MTERKRPVTCSHPTCPCHPHDKPPAPGGPPAWPYDRDTVPIVVSGWRDVGHGPTPAHYFTGVTAYPLCQRGFYWGGKPPAGPDAPRCPACLDVHARTSAHRVTHGLEALP